MAVSPSMNRSSLKMICDLIFALIFGFLVFSLEAWSLSRVGNSLVPVEEEVLEAENGD